MDEDFQIHRDELFRFARRLCRDREEAIDLVQETLLRVLRSGTCFHSREHARAWHYRTLTNLARDRRRRLAVREREMEEIAGPASSPGENAALARLAVQEALARLDPRRRAVLVLHEIEGRSVREIGHLLGLAPVTVRWHLMMARRKLAEILS